MAKVIVIGAGPAGIMAAITASKNHEVILLDGNDRVGKKLFIRENKGVALSKEGIELYNLISNEIHNIIKAENVFSRIISNNEIKIAIHPTFLNYFIDTKKNR